jgi:hypothetical protein
MAGGAMAQEAGIGIFFSDSEFTDANTNTSAGGSPQDMFVVLLGGPFDTIAAYELGITFTGVAPFILAATGPGGWTNFGTNENHLVGYQVAQPLANGALVLCTMSILATDAGTTEILIGPSDPSSFDPQVPGIANGANPDDLLPCGLTAGQTVPGVVATINGGGITATESRTLSDVKSLFE